MPNNLLQTPGLGLRDQAGCRERVVSRPHPDRCRMTICCLKVRLPKDSTRVVVRHAEHLRSSSGAGRKRTRVPRPPQRPPAAPLFASVLRRSTFALSFDHRHRRQGVRLVISQCSACRTSRREHQLRMELALCMLEPDEQKTFPAVGVRHAEQFSVRFGAGQVGLQDRVDPSHACSHHCLLPLWANELLAFPKSLPS
jgi:hypothetical protein